jgi:hypothetical protein
LLRGKVGADLHIGSATWAAPGSQLWVRDAWIGLALAVELKASECEQGRSVGTGEIAKVANADETSGQDMLAKAAQELGSGESHDPLLIAVSIVFPSESDVMTIEAKQTVVADGHAMCVTTKVAKYAIRLPKSRLGIDYPVLE